MFNFCFFFFKSSPAVWITEPSFTHGSNCPLDIARWIILVMSRRDFMQKRLPVNWVPFALFKISRLFPWPGLTQLSSSLTERAPKGDNCPLCWCSILAFKEKLLYIIYSKFNTTGKLGNYATGRGIPRVQFLRSTNN